jgi:hypothetical protein
VLERAASEFSERVSLVGLDTQDQPGAMTVPESTTTSGLPAWLARGTPRYRGPAGCSW